MSTFIDKTTLAAAIATAFDTISVKELRPRYVFDALCREKEWDLNTNPSKGDKISFQNLAALDANTSALQTTNTSITGQETLTYTRRTVTLNPYGRHSTLDMFESHNETMVDDVADAGWALADQAENSMNLIARDALDANKYSNESSGTLSSTSHMYGSYTSTLGPLNAKTVRKVVARFRSNNVRPFSDGMYRGVIDQNQYTQLRADSGDAGWTKSIRYTDSAPFVAGEIGDFENVRFIMTNQNKVDGSTYSSYFMGQDAVGRAVGNEVGVYANPTLQGPQQNLLVMNWNALKGYRTIHREASIIVSTTGDTK